MTSTERELSSLMFLISRSSHLPHEKPAYQSVKTHLQNDFSAFWNPVLTTLHSVADTWNLLHFSYTLPRTKLAIRSASAGKYSNFVRDGLAAPKPGLSSESM